MNITGNISKNKTINGKINGGKILGYISSSKIYENYLGNYEVTPNKTKQILNTQNLLMLDNVTINPIPENYGMITWNGKSLRVS